MKAMILAAGLGTRLLPLTIERPKPIFPVLGKPLLEYTLELLKKAGVREVIINLHHHPIAIENQIGNGKRHGLQITYSYEPQILGSGGGLKKVESFLNEGTFFLINGDILIDIDLKKVLRFHRKNKAFATMVLRKEKDLAKYGAICIDKNKRIRHFPGSGLHISQNVGKSKTYPHFVKCEDLTPLMFTGVHVLEPEIFEHIPEGVFSNINRVSYPKLLNEKRIFGYPFQGFWRECGNPLDYFSTNMESLNSNGTHKPRKFPQCQFIPPIWVGKNCTFGKKSVVGPNVILGEGCRIGAGAKITDTIVWDQVSIRAGELIEGSIVGKKERIQLKSKL